MNQIFYSAMEVPECAIIVGLYTTQKMKFSIKDFWSKCDQIRRKLRIWSHLLKKSLIFIFCTVGTEIIWTCNSNLNLNFKLTWCEIDLLNYYIYIFLNYHHSGSPQRRFAESSSFYLIRWQWMLLICFKRPYCNVLDLLEQNNKALDSNSYYTLFLRVYVTDDTYTSTGWYPVVLTLGDDECEEGTSM